MHGIVDIPDVESWSEMWMVVVVGGHWGWGLAGWRWSCYIQDNAGFMCTVWQHCWCGKHGVKTLESWWHTTSSQSSSSPTLMLMGMYVLHYTSHIRDQHNAKYMLLLRDHWLLNPFTCEKFCTCVWAAHVIALSLQGCREINDVSFKELKSKLGTKRVILDLSCVPGVLMSEDASQLCSKWDHEPQLSSLETMFLYQILRRFQTLGYDGRGTD